MPQRVVGTRLALPRDLLVDVLAALSAAPYPHDVAGAVLAPLVEVGGVRAAAVVQRAGPEVVVVASAGYDCGSFAASAALPLHSGLPLTEAVRTGRVIVRGPGPSWVALPVVARGRVVGGLLLSLHCAPPAQVGLAVLQCVARALGPALERAECAAAREQELVLLGAGLQGAGEPALTGVELAVRTRPLAGLFSGDVVACTADRGGGWLLVADVVGSGAGAAPVAAALRAVLPAVTALCRDPAEVLRALDRAVPAAQESFATALVLRVRGDAVDLASAGHPLPLLVGPAGGSDPVRAVVAEPGLPLGCALGPQDSEVVTVRPGRALLVAWTDGLLDRCGEVDLGPLLAPLGDSSPEVVADAVLGGCEAGGPAQDDVSLVVLRLAAT